MLDKKIFLKYCNRILWREDRLGKLRGRYWDQSEAESDFWECVEEYGKDKMMEQSDIEFNGIMAKQDEIEKRSRLDELRLFEIAVNEETFIEALPEGDFERGLHRVGTDLLKRIKNRIEELNK